MSPTKSAFKRVPLSDLSTCDYNPNVMDASGMKKLIASIREGTKAARDWNPRDGYRLATTITVNANGLRIVGGAHRTDALEQLGQDWIHEDDITWIDVPAGGAREKAINVELNRRDAQGDFDADKLALVLSDVQTEAPDLYLCLDMNDLAIEEAAEADASADDAPEAPEEPTSAPGELYRLGDHLLLCADCTDAENLHRLIKPGEAEAVFTDPPYNMDYKSKKLGGIKNDCIGEAAFIRLILASCASMRSALREGGAYYVCMGAAEYPTVANQMKRLGMEHRLIIWIKEHIGLGSQDYRPQFEVILYGATGEKKDRIWKGGRRESDVWEFNATRNVFAYESGEGMLLEFGAGVETTRVLLDKKSSGQVVEFDGSASELWRVDRERGAYVHPTQKPVALVERALLNSTQKGGVVFDPFAGSGSTVIASERTGRHARAVEMDPKYCDVIRRRWAEYTAGKECDWRTLTPAVN